MKDSRAYIIKKVNKWLKYMLEGYNGNNAYFTIKVEIKGRDLTTNDAVISQDFYEALHLKDDVEFISLKELNEAVKK